MAVEYIPLALVPRALRDRKLAQHPPGYKRVYGAVLDGRIPAEQGPNGRWFVKDRDLPLIAATLCSDAEARAA